ncbi:uncharacterized protein LOC110824976, partial [Carica papaya]|uniref:uncharacterized protein LOC110824976 n=1 Tax=Carica papaya TaxID=3649 RepID=UPI000B8CD3F5
MQEESLRSNDARVNVSTFDYSVENHLNVMDKISKLCGEGDFDHLDESEIQRLSSSITFLREWKHYTYKPRNVSFACEVGSSSVDKEVVNDVLLPQFSSATVVNSKSPSGNASSLESSKDFVMYVGGSVWALDWCPRVHELPDDHMRCEFVAVAAHPPDSYYHKMGVPQIGRGIVQIWSIVNVSSNEAEVLPPKKNLKQRSKKNESAEGESTQLKRPRGRPRKKSIEEYLDNDATKGKPEQPKRPRGRPRKKPVGESLDNLDDNNQLSQAAAIQNPEDTLIPIAIEDASMHTEENSLPDKQDKRKQETSSLSNSAVKLPIRSRKLRSKARAESGSDTEVLGQNESMETPSLNTQGHFSTGPDSFVSENLLNGCSSDAGLSSVLSQRRLLFKG